MNAALLRRVANLEGRVLHRTPKLNLPTPHATQQRIISEARRFNVACLGRRSGKTTLGVRLLIERAMQGVPVAWLSPTYKMLLDVWREVRGILYNAPRISDAEHRIDLHSGGIIEMWSLEKPDAIRGRKFALVVIDEAAMVKDLETVFNAVIRPTLVDLRGVVWMLSTPRGRNFFWQCFQRGQANDNQWVSWQMPTECNPHLDFDEIQAMREALPERIARQEIDAEAINEGGAVFRNIEECVYSEQPTPSGIYVIGVDIGRNNDFTVATVFDVRTKSVVEIDRYTGVSFSIQEERIIALRDKWSPQVIVVEVNNFGVPFIERLVARGVAVRPFQTTNASKQHIIDRLAMAFEHRSLSIPNFKPLIDELMAFEINRTPSGLIHYAAPNGYHDDTVMSLAFAYFASESF